MSEAVSMEKKSKIGPVSAFVIEADDPQNADVFFQVLGLKLRSKIKPVKEILDYEDGMRVRKAAPAKVLPGLPSNIPGMTLEVHPSKCSWIVSDPLREDQDTMDKIRAAMKQSSGVNVGDKLRGVPTKEGTLGVDEMKTLMKEILCLLEAGHVRVIRGKKPEMEDIKEMPGEFLLNWRQEGNWNQPRYEKDLEKWKQTLNRLG